MCGIFGAVDLLGHGLHHAFDDSYLIHLCSLNMRRGNLGHGVFVDGGGGQVVYRQARPVQLDRLNAVLAMCAPLECVLGHTRAPTSGSYFEASNDTCHPFTNGRFWLAHNGVLTNWDASQFDEAHRISIQPRDIDTRTLLAVIHQQVASDKHPAAAIAAVMTSLHGQQACWCWDSQLRQLWLWRVMSPIYYVISRGGFAFSSTCVEGDMELFPDGCYACVGAHGVEWFGPVAYYSPYLEVEELHGRTS